MRAYVCVSVCFRMLVCVCAFTRVCVCACTCELVLRVCETLSAYIDANLAVVKFQTIITYTE